MNMKLARGILQSLWREGVREIVLCAGARNAPFVASLSQPGPMRVHSFFEERSASFFALGRIAAEGRPVAVITTSGTAAAELLPATIEADYQGLPLILITADRPRRYRGSGAPQSIQQVGIFSHYVAQTWDIEGEWNDDFKLGARPVHLNVCWDEPLLDAEVVEFRPEAADSPLRKSPPTLTPIACTMKKPLILVSGLPRAEIDSVKTWLKKSERPLYLEAPSQLRGHPELAALEIRGGDRTLKALDYDGVIRIGGVPTLRLWRDLENSQLPILHFSHLPFSGLPRVPEVHSLSDLPKVGFLPWSEAERHSDREAASFYQMAFEKYALSEPAWVQWLSGQIPREARLFLGNSLPIREWDLAASRETARDIFVNRGVNGIDGLISTFLGVSSARHSNWALIGDLSALYDLSGPWAARELGITDLNLVILNNGGGQIFHRMFRNPLFENPHGLNFRAWAEMWGWDYLRLDQPQDLVPAKRPRVIEIVPNTEQTEAFWESLK